MPKVILDACCNHFGVPVFIEEMIAEAEKNGVDYIKFQLYDSQKLNPKYPNFEDTQSRLMSTELKDFDVKHILNLCLKLKITPMFTIFDHSRIKWLTPKCLSGDLAHAKFALKVASPDMLNFDLIETLLTTFPDKELFVSCGMHTKRETRDITKRYEGYPNMRFLYCVSMYPTPYEAVDFAEMSRFNGFSDHTIGLDAIRVALDLYPYLEYFEKHFILSRNLPAKDGKWSIEPGELASLMAIIRYKENCTNYKKRWKVEA